MELCQLSGNAKAKAEVLFICAGTVSLVETVKNIRLYIIRNSLAFVGDLDCQQLF